MTNDVIYFCEVCKDPIGKNLVAAEEPYGRVHYLCEDCAREKGMLNDACCLKCGKECNTKVGHVCSKP